MAEAEHPALVDSIGTQLRHGRQRHGFSREDIGLQLKLPLGMVDALERDDFATVGAPIYVRGFVRSYARLVGLPETGFDASLRAHFEAVQPELKPSHGARRSINWGERYSWAFSYLVGTALVLTLIWTVIGFDNDAHQIDLQAAAEPLQPATGLVEASAPATGSDQLFSAGLEAAGATTPAPLLAAPRASEQFPVIASLSPFSGSGPVRSSDASFELLLSGQSWTEITDASGTRVAFGTLQSGSRSFGGNPPYTLLLGNASVAQLRVAGQLLDLQPFMRANVARLKLEAVDGSLRAVAPNR